MECGEGRRITTAQGPDRFPPTHRYGVSCTRFAALKTEVKLAPVLAWKISMHAYCIIFAEEASLDFEEED
ncbi:hypothetical protein VM1G_11668 [Cytospora mali]|uniref:Uncharacterized protein n=1 Tax=Cytospora mali TaxID=578113 RepID=A0A194W1A2_CYTMA|nr:hypothetical protein VM1G_11668 [Valsa mali]